MYLTDIENLLTYYYTHNSRGDIVGIYNGAGQLRAHYEYDAWGNVLSVTDQNGNAITSTTHIGNLNPFRYRGYYYDTESGLYYLMSRYYDPVTHRFINADGYFQAGGGILDGNMSAYCRNNPVMNSDPSGQWFIKALIKYVVRNVIKPITKTIQTALSKVPITKTNGIAGSFSLGMFSYGGQIGVSTDTKGNVSLQATVSTSFTASSGSSPKSASIYAYGTVTNAPSTDYLSGGSCQIGGSYGQIVEGVPAVAIADFNLIPDKYNQDNLYLGFTGGVGLGCPGAEGHIGLSNTWDLMSCNLFDISDTLYEKMEAW